ncbi:MAG: peptidylprolyl isomerase [Desulfurococcales archaeon]|nr:peptidylprolyl isomerase [Desulfurococcales archaeon]
MALKEGDMVLIHYTIKVVDGEEEIVETTREDVAKKAGIYDPNKSYGEYLVVVGKSTLIDAVNEALKEMSPGDKREIEAPPEKAYGEWRQDLLIRIPLKQFRRHNIVPRVGQEVEVGGRVGRIVRMTERFAYVDFNHPLAGKKLKIELEVLKKLENDEEKLGYLAKRWLNTEPVTVKAGDEAEIVLPSDVLGLRDLDSRLQLLSRDVYLYVKPKKLRITVEVEYPEEAEKAEGGEASSEGS